jgi:hypothetical protein
MVKQKMTEAQLVEMFNDCLNCNGNINVLGMEFEPADLLNRLDPIRYQCDLRDFADSIRDEYIVEGWND